MQLFAPCNILALVALLSASMVSAQSAVSNAYAKPIVTKSGGFVTATLDVAASDLRRRLQDARANTSRILDDKMLSIQAFFYNNWDSEIANLQSKEDKEEKIKKDKEKKEKKPGCSAKSTDDLQFKSAKMWPNVKPKVNYEVDTIGDSITLVTWDIPIDDIEEDKKYTFDVKLKVGPDADGASWVLWFPFFEFSEFLVK